MTLRILIVDDHVCWREHVSSAVQKDPRYQVVGEVGDGSEAVEAAERLKPDLIVLDVGLPTLNGIEVAQRVLALVPGSNILFVSEHRSQDIVEAALRTGARGYVLKSDAGPELLPAIDAILEGRLFLSARLRGESIREDFV